MRIQPLVIESDRGEFTRASRGRPVDYSGRSRRSRRSFSIDLTASSYSRFYQSPFITVHPRSIDAFEQRSRRERRLPPFWILSSQIETRWSGTAPYHLLFKFRESTRSHCSLFIVSGCCLSRSSAKLFSVLPKSAGFLPL